MRGEKIYEYDLDVTGVTDYGVTLEAILSGQVNVPPQRVRIDVAFVGHASGRLAKYVVSTMRACAPMAAATSISGQP